MRRMWGREGTTSTTTRSGRACRKCLGRTFKVAVIHQQTLSRMKCGVVRSLRSEFVMGTKWRWPPATRLVVLCVVILIFFSKCGVWLIYDAKHFGEMFAKDFT